MSVCFNSLYKRIFLAKIKKANNISVETENTLLEACDPLTLSATAILPQDYIKQNAKPPTDDQVKTGDVDLGWKKIDGEWIRTELKEYDKRVSPNFETSILGEDDLFTTYTCFEKCVGKTIRSKIIHPLIDTAVYVEDNTILQETLLGEGQAQPESYNTDFNMQTDESFSRIFFYGLGAVLLCEESNNDITRLDLGPYMVDIPLQELEVRDGFRRYGCRIHFDDNQIVSAIHDYAKNKTYKRNDKDWQEAKWLAKVNTFFLVTVKHHLIWTHLVVSNVTTRETIVHLPPDHPLRRLLTIFTYRSTEINTSAFDVLIPENSLLHRACALEYPSMVSMFDTAYVTSNAYEPFVERKVKPELVTLSKQGKFPYLSEGFEYYEIVDAFVRDWITEAGTENILDESAMLFYDAMRDHSFGQKYVIPSYQGTEGMIKLLSQIIFSVTAMHELVGTVVDYTSDINRAGFRIGNTEKVTIDVQSLLLTSIIAASTSLRMPSLMEPYPNFFYGWERKVWDRFLSKLKDQSKKVEEAEKNRKFEFKYFDPCRFECSVSL
ncbi:hypothetical protein CTEN210_05296 [Chaetoceros tenuissimus]|uniref:Lipoxygenase domain-containing protein n=1 Tax=Chaetoceros tenuissimus TaxID=426638 RepID=A0AAD3CPF7_9STRA|nr:hypothetical protein CTEN210_05296 [Chaetoceros tenuissimus]